ncbi:MAG: hypothetical protein EP341_06950 [Sphingomonadales bacterium]|nr:MAG: hypothetical protein EP341_06950 [Sphingomonadales bacterium]
MERIDRRVPIKVIALELGISDTRVNQHIRALKDHFQVYSLNELVECYRAEFGDESSTSEVDDAEPKGLSETEYRKNELEDLNSESEEVGRVDPGEIVLSDIMSLTGQAMWKVAEEPKVVPGMLDGDHAVLARLAVIVGIAFGILAAVVLAVTASITISDALDGKASVPDDYLQPSS